MARIINDSDFTNVSFHLSFISCQSRATSPLSQEIIFQEKAAATTLGKKNADRLY